MKKNLVYYVIFLGIVFVMPFSVKAIGINNMQIDPLDWIVLGNGEDKIKDLREDFNISVSLNKDGTHSFNLPELNGNFKYFYNFLNDDITDNVILGSLFKDKQTLLDISNDIQGQEYLIFSNGGLGGFDFELNNSNKYTITSEYVYIYIVEMDDYDTNVHLDYEDFDLLEETGMIYGFGCFKINDGVYFSSELDGVDDIVVNYAADGSIKLPNVSKEGYEFLGWYSSLTNGNKIGNINDIVTTETLSNINEKTFYGKWKKIKKEEVVEEEKPILNEEKNPETNDSINKYIISFIISVSLLYLINIFRKRIA